MEQASGTPLVRRLRVHGWFGVALAIAGVASTVWAPPLGLTLVALGAGSAAFSLALDTRLPRFAPIPVVLNLQYTDPKRIEGNTQRYRYTLVFPLLIACVLGPVAALISDPLSVFGFVTLPAAATLLAFAWLYNRREAASSVAAQALLSPPPSGRIRLEGTVEADNVPLHRRVTWCTLAGSHHGTETVTSVSGQQVQVQTVTHTSNTYGLRDEARRKFNVRAGDQTWRVDPRHATWAARVITTPGRPPGALDMENFEAHLSSEMVLRAGATAYDDEDVRSGHAVLAIGTATTAQALSGSADAPLLLFAAPSGENPAETLRASLRRRTVFLATLIGCAALSLVATLPLWLA